MDTQQTKLLGSQTVFGKFLADKLDNPSDSREAEKKQKRIFGKPLEPQERVLEGPGIPPVARAWEQEDRWNLVCSGPWNFPEERINIKEARVALMSLRRLCRSVHNMDTVSMTLCDNMTTILAYEKGRSSSGGINALCRRAAAYQIASSIQWRLKHIETHRNVADKPSRQWDNHDSQARQSKISSHLGGNGATSSSEQGHWIVWMFLYNQSMVFWSCLVGKELCHLWFTRAACAHILLLISLKVQFTTCWILWCSCL